VTIKIWQSYSSNNSSSYRLVARFADPRIARETAAELATFLIDHIAEIRGRWLESEVARDLADRYGFTWTDIPVWSVNFHVGDEPEIAVDRDVLVVYHHYCLGFGDLPLFLEAKGAVVEPQAWQPPTVSILFRSRAGESPELDSELAALLAQYANPPGERKVFEAPWRIRHDLHGDVAGFRDPGTVGLWIPLAPTDMPALERWLADRGIEQPSIRWCEYGDEALFTAIAKARCTACSGSLEYLDPRIHDIETPQLACTPCGGLYELATFMTAAAT